MTAHSRLAFSISYPTSVFDHLREYHLQKNDRLKGDEPCDWSLPISGTWGFGEKEVPVRYLEIKESATRIIGR